MKIWRTRRRLVLGLALGLVAASVVAGPAQAKPDDLNGTLSYADDQVAVDGWANKYVAEEPVLNLPDGRAGDPATFGTPAATPATVDDGSGFSWRDAGLGAFAAVILIGVMTGSALALRHGRSSGGKLATS